MGDTMDILEFALEKERLSCEYYQQIAAKTDNSGLRNILEMLAEEESAHYQVIENMRSQVHGNVTETDVLEEAKVIFDGIKDCVEKFDFSSSEVELYRDARDKKQKSMEFYLEKAHQVEDEKQKEIFLKLADEEQKHLIVIDNICEFVASPECYLENAEFVHTAEDF
jgi:rubrerythrin